MRVLDSWAQLGDPADRCCALTRRICDCWATFGNRTRQGPGAIGGVDADNRSHCSPCYVFSPAIPKSVGATPPLSNSAMSLHHRQPGNFGGYPNQVSLAAKKRQNSRSAGLKVATGCSVAKMSDKGDYRPCLARRATTTAFWAAF